MARKFFTWLLLFIGITLVLQSFRGTTPTTGPVDDIVLSTTESSYVPGNIVQLEITNNLERILDLKSDCPSEPFDVERYANGVWESVESTAGLYVQCDGIGTTDPVFFVQPEFIQIAPKTTQLVDYAPWNQELFEELGRYRITVSTSLEDVEKAFTTEFEIEERGFFSSVSFHLFYRPIYNFLLYLTSVLPGFSFGFAVIVLTMIIRLLLLVPNQKALKSQRSMMKIQPEIEAIKKKYKGNQEKISQETIALWRKHRVNPVGGCLPLLIQLPILIALFYVVKGGFSPYQGHMLYAFLQGVDLTQVNTIFLGVLDLEMINITWLPLLVGFMQFIQLKLSFSRKIKQNTDKKVIDIGEKKKDEKKKNDLPQNPMQMMSKSMMYFMPVMIALMVASLPSGVGLYLLVSTLFGIGQQYFVNRSID